MPSIIANNGDVLVSEHLLGQTTELLDVVALGTGTATPTETDTSLANELYRSTRSDSNVSIDLSGSEPGEIVARITVSGGTEVSAGTTITEIGLLGDQDTLLYRETFSGVTIDSGDRKTFEFAIEPDN